MNRDSTNTNYYKHTITFTRDEVAAILTSHAKKSYSISGGVICQTVQAPSERDEDETYDVSFVTE